VVVDHDLQKAERTSFFKKSTAAMSGALMDYILAAADESGQDKTKPAGAKNLLSRTPDGWKAEMISLASESIQNKMPVTHWLMSWQKNQQPNHEQIKDAVDVFLERMGWQGIRSSWHGNCANQHLHIVVTRTNPDLSESHPAAPGFRH
jgi:hypothetical protein